MCIRTHIVRLLTTLMLLAVSATVHAQSEDVVRAFDGEHLLAYMVAAMLITVFVMFFYNRLCHYREQETSAQMLQFAAQLELVLDSNNTQAWLYNSAKRLCKRLSKQGTIEKEYTPYEFSLFYDHNDFAELRKILVSIIEGNELSGSMVVRGAMPKDKDEKQRIYDISASILRRDKYNRPTALLCTQRDITEESERKEKARKMLLQYHTVFNSSLVDMAFFDANGVLMEINERARESFHVKDRKELLGTKLTFSDLPSLRGLDFQTTEQTYTSSLLDGSYYEQMVTPLHDAQGKLSGMVIAGRNITEMVQSHHHQQQASRLLEKTTKDTEEYIKNINYALKVGAVMLVNYDPDKHELELSSDLNKTLFRLSQVRAISTLTKGDRRKARGFFRRMDRRREGIIVHTLRTGLRDKQGRNIHLYFNVMPIHDKNGYITHYFGMCRNDTEAVYTEIQLRKETEKAQETEQVKEAFLLNMSHELRTPLSSVIGFADLFNQEHNPEDEPLFAKEIKRNTNDLLQLVNDILFLSRIDAHMVEHTFELTDFASAFESYCYLGWSTLPASVSMIVENPYERLLVKVDMKTLGLVIQKLCLNSAYMTKEGFVLAKYEYRGGGLNISIEDTGMGIDPEMLPKIFDRFVRNKKNERYGSGLDLAIVQELVKQMNGTIEVQSGVGKGTTFYVSIPCEMTDMEKKDR
ncbi:MAG: hypothetical protein J1E58_04345 [Prevotella sp.]|nr:hypothetical protein [Prevotella sp.]